MSAIACNEAKTDYTALALKAYGLASEAHRAEVAVFFHSKENTLSSVFCTFAAQG